MKDQAIIQALQTGNTEALKELITQYQGLVPWAGRRFHFPQETIRDLYTDSVIDFYERVKQGRFEHRDDNSVKNFLMTVLNNKLVNLLEKTNNRHRLQDKVNAASESWLYNGTYDDTSFEKIAIIKAAMEQLPTRCQQSLRLYYFEGLSMKEIAEALGYSSEETARSTKYQCYKKLQALIKRKYHKNDF